MLLKGNNQIKKYILNHMLSLIVLEKEIIVDIKLLFSILNQDFSDCNKIIISIIKIFINKGKDFSYIFKDEAMIEKVKQVDRSLLYILMRDPKIYDFLIDIINEEADNIDIDEIVDNYGDQMNKSVYESFEEKEQRYLTINLSEIYNNYNHYYEYYMLKQLPFNVVLQTIENKDKRNEYILNNYMEYDGENVSIISKPQFPNKIIFDDTISGIQIICLLGRITISKNCNAINNASNFLTFSIKDILKEITPYEKSKNLFKFQKDGVNLILKQEEAKSKYLLEAIFFNIRIIPDIIVGFKMPVNLLTELNNNKKGFDKLVEKKCIEKLIAYFENIKENEIDKNAKKIKSAMWILNKITLKKIFGKIIEEKYKITQRMNRFYINCTDCSIKGTIIYITSTTIQNRDLKSLVDSYHAAYFNSNICYPSERSLLIIDNFISYENEKLKKDINLILSKINLSPICEKIYNNITNLINNITFKQSIFNLDELYTNNCNDFYNINLFVKIYAILARYKYKEGARRAIMLYFEKCINSSEVALKSSLLLKSFDKNILNAHELE